MSDASQLTRARFQQMEQRLAAATAIIEELVHGSTFARYTSARAKALAFLRPTAAPQAEGAQP